MDKAKGKESVMIKKEDPGTDSPKDSSNVKESEETTKKDQNDQDDQKQ